MEAMKCASKAESDSLAMKEFYINEIAKQRRENDMNNIKFVTATGVPMDKWDGGVDSLRKLLLQHEEEVATRRLAAKTYTRASKAVHPPAAVKVAAPAAASAAVVQSTAQISTAVFRTTLQVSPAVTTKVTAEVNKAVKESDAEGGGMEIS